MKAVKILVAIALAQLASAGSQAQAPATIGDSFLSLSIDVSNVGLTGSCLIYFGADGTFMQLSLILGNASAGGTVYSPSSTGTYTYTPSTSDPNQASIVLTLAQPTSSVVGYFMTVEYAAATTGAMTFAPQSQYGPMYYAQGPFSQLVHAENDFLTNVSNRVTLRPSDTAISGFVVQGGGNRLVLVRAVGPTLAQFGVNPVSKNPQLGIFQGTGATQIATGQIWDSGASVTMGYDAQAMSWVFSKAGAFPLGAGSNDVAFFSVLSPGVYTAQTFDATMAAAGGSALTEVYILPYSG
jgi:hypothetical protein